MGRLASCFARTTIKNHTHTNHSCTIRGTGEGRGNQKTHNLHCGLGFIYLYVCGNLSHDTGNKMLTFNIADIYAISQIPTVEND